jgi:hypothetical protein
MKVTFSLSFFINYVQIAGEAYLPLLARIQEAFPGNLWAGQQKQIIA